MHPAEAPAPRGGAPQPARGAAPERRVARDGRPYTWLEFATHYGSSAGQYWHQAPLADEARETANAGAARQVPAHAAEGGAPQPAQAAADAQSVPIHHGSASPAAQLAVDAHGAPQPAVASDAVQLAVIADGQAQPLRCVCTYGELAATQPVQGAGGKMAHRKQREVREVCMRNALFEMELTENWPEWRACLRALLVNVRRSIAGMGIAQFKLCLLEVEGLVILKPFFLVIYGQISEVQALKM